MKRRLLPILSAVLFATGLTSAARAESRIPDSLEKQGITIQIGTPSRSTYRHSIYIQGHPSIRYSSRRPSRYYRNGYRPNRRIYRRIYRQYPDGGRPNRRTFRYYRYDQNHPQGHRYYHDDL
ncbi:MAG: hypothetical protein AAGF01_16035 [Cyanobacteria bacterium P01_G01_bin.38]